MTSNRIVVEMVLALEAAKVPYMLVGSYSSNMYSVPRSTRDADFVVELAGESINLIAQHLGPGFVLDPQMSFETVTATMRYKIKHAEIAFAVELFLISSDPYDRSRFNRRVRRPFEDIEVYVATVEDVIVNKLRWHRPKDMEDVATVIALRQAEIDWEYVHRWCDTHGTRALLASAIAAIPKRSGA